MIAPALVSPGIRLAFGRQLATQQALVAGADVSGQKAHHAGLENAANVEDVPRVLDRGPRDGGAAVSLELDQALMGELVQYLADHGSADAEGLGQRILGQLGARREVVLDDRRQQMLVDIRVARRCGRRLRRHERDIIVHGHRPRSLSRVAAGAFGWMASTSSGSCCIHH